MYPLSYALSPPSRHLTFCKEGKIIDYGSFLGVLYLFAKVKSIPSYLVKIQGDLSRLTQNLDFSY